jgi:hypothetical protein
VRPPLSPDQLGTVPDVVVLVDQLDVRAHLDTSSSNLRNTVSATSSIIGAELVRVKTGTVSRDVEHWRP